MALSGNDKKLAEELYIALQPIRRKILEQLRSGSMYIEQLAKNMDEDRKNVGFHLMTLSDHGFISGEVGVIKLPEHHSKEIRGRTAKFYSLTEKGNKAIDILGKLLKEDT
jgi:predicted ArsR family transcriptional regulator